MPIVIEIRVDKLVRNRDELLRLQRDRVTNDESIAVAGKAVCLNMLFEVCRRLRLVRPHRKQAVKLVLHPIAAIPVLNVDRQLADGVGYELYAAVDRRKLHCRACARAVACGKGRGRRKRRNGGVVADVWWGAEAHKPPLKSVCHT